MERYHIFKLGLAILFYAAYCIRPMVVNGQEVEDNETQTKKFSEADLVFYQGVEGKPGVDFPVLSHIPRTSFNCRDVGSGYYADLETDCQVFHICEDSKKISFLCPNGTIFEQSELTCEWWFKVNCTNSPNLYEESAEQLREEAARRKLSRRVNHHGAVMRMEERSSVSTKQNGNRASKRVSLNGGNRINNHASTYRDNLEDIKGNDLSRSSTSDFVRNDNENGDRKQKKPVQFQTQPSIDNQNLEQNQNGKNSRNRQGNRRRLEPSSENRSRQKFLRSQEELGTTRQNQDDFPTTRNRNSQFNTFRNGEKNQGNDKINTHHRGQKKFNNLQTNVNQFEAKVQQANPYDEREVTNRNKESSANSRDELRKGEEISTIDRQISNEREGTTRPQDPYGKELPSRSITDGKNSVKYPANRNQGSFLQSQNSFNSEYLPTQTNTNYRENFSIRNSKHGSSFEKTTQNINPRVNDFSQQDSTTQKLNLGTNVGQNQDSKVTNLQQKSTVPLTRNDIVNRRLEHSYSDETQITQETASFYKNSRNKIDESYKSTNPHPNHRETYSELREPKYYTTKSLSTISSVTPQYLTTQPINKGRPFIGSQVGTTLNNSRTSTINYFSTTSIPFTTNYNLFNVGKTSEKTNTLSPSTEKFNVGRTDKTLHIVSSSTPPTPRIPNNVTIPLQGSFNLGTSTSKAISSTGKIIDHATVYGKFVKSSSTPPTKILLSKSLFGGTVPTPFSKPKEDSPEILSTSDSSNRGNSQVRFFGKVQSSSKVPGVDSKFNVSSTTSFNSLNSFSSTPQPFSLNSNNVNSVLSTTAPFTSKVNSGYISTFSPESNSVTPTYLSTTSTELSLKPTFLSTTPSPEFMSISTTQTPEVSTILKQFNPGTPNILGFFVTENTHNSLPPQKSRISEIGRPRPFELPPVQDFRGKAVYTTPATTTPTHPTYQISSASPFAEPSTPQPTQPTPFTTALPTTFENVDSMINALAEMATQNFSENPRPGLVIPPSAGPQTLHTLAVYFANALDGIAVDKEENNGEEEEEEEDESGLTRVELEKKRLTELLTQMTMDRYNELFHDDQKEKEEEPTTVSPRSGSDADDNDLEGQHSKGLAQKPPKVRQLAKVFTQALSSYLDDPDNFKKVLEEIRPTEPPAYDSDDGSEDELLNFSDADSKSSYPPFFPTAPSIRPTWGYLIAYNTSRNLDVKNFIGPENENLQGSDSQSFISQFNKLQTTNKPPSTQLPQDHWTSSPDARDLFRTAFSFDPAAINENFGTTELSTATTEENTEKPERIQPHHEINYELKVLPNLELNETQVHGILIDFMNTTKQDRGSRLQRILQKLNTTEDEFLAKMKEIESNPLTRRLILLLINECGSDVPDKVDTHLVPLHNLLDSGNKTEILETSSSVAGYGDRNSKPQRNVHITDTNLDTNSEDARALQLLNSLYTIASKFGK